MPAIAFPVGPATVARRHQSEIRARPERVLTDPYIALTMLANRGVQPEISCGQKTTFPRRRDRHSRSLGPWSAAARERRGNSMTITRVTGFLPSSRGLHFENDFAQAPVITVNFPLLGPRGFGDASGGLCGGMAFTARDLFEAGLPP